jgi:hypothetical protein
MEGHAGAVVGHRGSTGGALAVRDWPRSVFLLAPVLRQCRLIPST